VTTASGTLTIEVWPPRPTSGQHCGSMSNGVRVTHHPSGIQAFVDCERSQHKNKALAVEMVEAALTHPFYRGIV